MDSEYFSKLFEGLKQVRLAGQEALLWKLAATAFVVFLAYGTGVAIYRLTLHPLAQFPGPFLCRISYIQQCYYEAILNGKFLERFPEYHRKYGTDFPFKRAPFGLQLICIG
jgi:hypothetical protein